MKNILFGGTLPHTGSEMRERERETHTHTHTHTERTHTHKGGEAHSPSLIERILFWGTLPHLGRQGVRGRERGERDPSPPHLHTGAKRHLRPHGRIEKVL